MDDQGIKKEVSTEDFLKIAKDPKLYIESFLKIKGKQPGLIPFILNKPQIHFLNGLLRNNRVIALKSRQIGFSTFCAAYIYWKTITTPGTTSALISHKADLSAEFLDKIKLFWRGTPETIRPKLHFNSKYEMSFPAIDSKIVVLSGENVGRGYTPHVALCSEVAFWPDPEEMMLAIENAVPASGQIIVESTPRGAGNLYHRMWMADNGYAKFEYKWHWLYTVEEIEEIKRRINDPLRFSQEYELEFLSSGRQVFDSALISLLKQHALNVGDKVKLEDGSLFTVEKDLDGFIRYKPPKADGLYVVGADVAEGVSGGDYSVATIFDRTTGEEVANFRGVVSADKFGVLLDKWGREYANALMVVEINNHGLTTITALKNCLYPKMYFRPAKFDVYGTKWSDRLGWKTTKVTRPLMMDDLGEALREGSLVIHSKETIEEMYTFIYDDNNRITATRGFNDDGIFATAIALQGFKILYDKPLDQIDYTHHLPPSGAY